MNTDNKIAEELHQQTIDLQAAIILNQQQDIDRLNSLAIDSAAEIARLNKVIEWLQGQTGLMLGAAAKAEAATLGPILVGDERVADRRTGERLAAILTAYRNGEREFPTYTDLRELCPVAPAAPLLADQSEQSSDYILVRAAAKDLFNKSFADPEVRISSASESKRDSVQAASLVFQAALKSTAEPSAAAPAAPLPELTGPSEQWMATFSELLEDYVGACAETAVFNATQRSMTVRMERPRFKKLMEHVSAASPSPAPAPTEPQNVHRIPRSTDVEDPSTTVYLPLDGGPCHVTEPQDGLVPPPVAAHVSQHEACRTCGAEVGGRHAPECVYEGEAYEGYPGKGAAGARKIASYGACKCVLSQYCDGRCNPIFADEAPPASRVDGITSKESVKPAAPGASTEDKQ